MDCARNRKACETCDSWRAARTGKDSRDDRRTAERCAPLKRPNLKNACADRGGVDESRLEALNERVIDALSRFHDAWVDRGDIFALLEANYLVDYYCTYIVNACDGDLAYDRRSEAMAKEVEAIARRRKLHWRVKDDTHDVFRKKMSYWNGFEKIRSRVFALRNAAVVDAGAGRGLGAGWRKRTVVSIDISLDDLIKSVKRAIDAESEYFASGWGMYRLENLNNYAPRRPCSCICRSLLILTLLYMCGVARERLFAHFQKPDGKKTRRFTHWAVSCEDTGALVKKYANRLKHLVSAEERRFNTSEAFAAFTRDIVFYYLRAVREFEYSSEEDRLSRRRALRSFKRKYDERYEAIAEAIRTPAASRGAGFLSAQKI